MLPANGPSRRRPRAATVAGEPRMLARSLASALILALLPALSPAQTGPAPKPTTDLPGVLRRLLELSGGQTGPAPKPTTDLPKSYERRTVLGFTVIAHHDLFLRGRDQYGRTPLDV